MSRSVNKVILLGRLGKDPELKYTPSGQAVTKFSLATSERWKDKGSGEFQERTEWHNIVLWSKLAETANQYLTKGSSVYLEGRLQTRSWEDKENKRHYMTEVVVSEMVMVGSRGEGAGRAAHAAAEAGPASDAPAAAERYGGPPTEITDDDIPF
ncbi:MAG: single-stranded DNA-binding protein [Acidobacteria bacterium]|nr:MAG: single-stranded DNA-binding protein [Acidobacteriota bacterium]